MYHLRLKSVVHCDRVNIVLQIMTSPDLPVPSHLLQLI